MAAASRRPIYCRLARILLLLLLLRDSTAARSSRPVVELSYDILEEQPTGSLVADVKLDANLTSLYELSVLSRLRFTFMRQYSTQLFTIDASTGVVRSADRVDREQLCPSSIGDCVVRIDIAIRPVDYFCIVRLGINIVDVNDHKPAFRDRQLTVDVFESAGLGSTISLPLAADPDSPPLSVVEYRLMTSLDADMFALVHDQRPTSGFDSLGLELVSGLDRESTPAYQVTILAVDGGTPAQTGSAQLTVHVIDVNDNRPQFQHTNYDVTVPEDVLPGTTLLRASAVDADDGLNGHVVYELAQLPFISADDLPFAVNNTTGEIIVLTSLDRDGGPSRYEFCVRARDLGVDSVSTDCLVVVQLTDVNDNAPNIIVDGLLSGEPQATETARVTENAREGTFVAHVTVIDPDLGASGLFNCSLVNDDDANATSYFTLNQFDETEFQLITGRAAPIDREQNAEFLFVIVCYDFGRPSLTSSRQVRVVVDDVNDQTPRFSRDVYDVEIIENNYVGASLLTVTAHDTDRADNARLTYSLDGPQSNNFRIDSVSGEVTAVMSFDREKTSTVSFTVAACDAGTPSLTGSAIVTVRVLDVNDNFPSFDVDSVGYSFAVDENQPVGTFVGLVYASDPDTDTNGNVSYTIHTDTSLIWATSSASLDSFTATFELCSLTGSIVTRRVLDAEDSDMYRFQVVAVDSGVPARSSTTSVVVVIGDVNDNRPCFIFPSLAASNNVAYVTASGVVLGHVVTVVRATDSDIGESSSSIVYKLTDDSDCFAIDRLSGIVRVVDETQLVGKEDGWTFQLTVTATDHGGLAASETLYVVVNSSVSEAMFISGFRRWKAFSVDTRYVVIMICIVTVCGVLIVGLVLVVSAVHARQRRSASKRRSTRRYNCRAAASLRLEQENAAAAETGTHLPPLNAWTVTDPAQSLLLVRRNNESTCNGQSRVKICSHNDQSLLNRPGVNSSPYSSSKVCGSSSTVMCRQQQTVSTFHFRSLPRCAANGHRQQQHVHHCQGPAPFSSTMRPHRSTCFGLPGSASQHALLQRRSDVSSTSAASAQEQDDDSAERLTPASDHGSSSCNACTDVSVSYDTIDALGGRNVSTTSSPSTVTGFIRTRQKLPQCDAQSDEKQRLLTFGSCGARLRRCPQDRQEDENVCYQYQRSDGDEVCRGLPASTNNRRRCCTSAVSDVRDPACPAATDGGGVVGIREEMGDDLDEEDEAWTTTSGSYNAADLCDEIDQLFFAQPALNRQDAVAD